MVTNRSIAKSEKQIELEVQAAVKTYLYERIESEIGRLGQCGFKVGPSLRSIIPHPRFLKAAAATRDEIVQEYRSAGWEVSLENDECGDNSGILTFR